MRLQHRIVLTTAALAAVAIALAGCEATSTSTSTSAPPSASTTTSTAPTRTNLALPTPGEVKIDGVSGTLTADARRAYLAAGAADVISESFHGTAKAYSELCDGSIDLVDSTQAISAAQLAACQTNGLQVVQFEVAADAVVVGIENATDVGGDCLRTNQLSDIFRAGSPITRWSQLGGGFLDLPLHAGAPNQTNADFALFARKVLNRSSPSLLDFRGDMKTFPSDVGTRVWLVGATDTPLDSYTPKRHAEVAFFHYSYYTLYEEEIRPFEVSAASGARNCIFPSLDSITSGTYPLSEQFLITTTTRSLKRSEVQGFLTDYLNRSTSLATDKQLVALSGAVIQSEKTWASGKIAPPVLEGTAATVPNKQTDNEPPS